MRQESAARHADEQQRRAHADAHGEECKAAAQDIARLTDHRQGRDHGWCDAGCDDEGGQRAHDGRADEAARFLPAGHACEARLERRRDLEVEEAEHREREDHEERGEGDDDPRMLEEGLGLLARGGKGGARDRVGQRHAEDIGHGQQERPPRCRRLALAGDDAREDGDHRQHAGREGEQQAEAEEARHDREQAAARDQARESILLRDHRCRFAGRWRAGRWKLDGDGLGHRRVAQARIRAALVAHLDLERWSRPRDASPAPSRSGSRSRPRHRRRTRPSSSCRPALRSRRARIRALPSWPTCGGGTGSSPARPASRGGRGPRRRRRR